MDFNVKSSNFQGFLLVSYARFRKISYLCPRIKAFFAYCKIQKRAEVRRFHIVTYIIKANAQVLDIQSKSNLV